MMTGGALVFGLAVHAAPLPTLRVGDELPATLNPLYANTLADLRAQELVWERLFRRSGIA